MLKTVLLLTLLIVVSSGHGICNILGKLKENLIVEEELSIVTEPEVQVFPVFHKDIDCQELTSLWYATPWTKINDWEVKYELRIESTSILYFLLQFRSNFTWSTTFRQWQLISCHSEQSNVECLPNLQTTFQQAPKSDEILSPKNIHVEYPFDTYNTTRYINMSTPGSQKLTVIYTNERIIVNNMAQACFLGIDARETAATHFEISLQIPDLSAEVAVSIFSNIGSDGVIELVMPSSQGSPGSYVINITKQLLPEGFGILTVGGLEVRIFGIDHLSILSLESTIDVYVEGTPANSDLLIYSIEASTVTASNLMNNLLLVNTTNDITWEMMSSNITVITAGEATIDNVNCSLINGADYELGALFTYSDVPKIPLSQWMIRNLAYFGISNFQPNASLVNFQTLELNIEIPSLSVIGMDRLVSSFHLSVINGNVSVTGLADYTWNSALIIGSSLEVYDRLVITLLSGYTGWIDAQLIQGPSATLEISTLFLPSSLVTWNVGDSNYKYIDWESSSSKGTLGFYNSSIDEAPLLIVSGDGDINLNLTLMEYLQGNYSKLMSRVIQVNQSIQVANQLQNGNQTISQIKLEVHIAPKVNASVTINLIDEMNHVNFTSFPSTPMFSLSNNASLNFTSQNADLSIEFPRTKMIFDYRKTSLYRADSSHNFWLQPTYHCNPYFWTEVLVHGSTPCPLKTEYQVILNVDLNTGISCYLDSIHNSNFSIQVNMNTTVNQTIRSPWMQDLVMFIFVVTAVFGATSLLIPFDKKKYLTSLFNFLGLHCLSAWSFTVWTCFVARLEPVKEKWTLNAFYLTHVAQEVVYNLFTGWFCSFEGKMEILSIILLWIIPLLDIIAIIVLSTLLKRKKDMKNEDEYTIKILAFLLNLGLLVGGTIMTLAGPFAISHISKHHLTTIVTLVFFLMLLAVVMVTVIRNGQSTLQKVNFSFLVFQYATVLVIAVLGNSDFNLSYRVNYILSFFFIVLILLIIIARAIVYSIIERRDNKDRRYSLFMLTFFLIACSIGLGCAFAVFLLQGKHQTEAVLFSIWLVWIALPFIFVIGLLLYTPIVLQAVKRNQETAPLIVNHPSEE